MIDKALVLHCSPTLAGLKSANIFNYFFTTKDELYSELEAFRDTLQPKGVSLRILRICGSRALIYVYRRDKVQDELRKPNVFNFLSKYGYETDCIDDCIEKLASRITSQLEFPHEIGLFLSYPLEDVIGFIENEGQNSRCTGCWKVYCNECEARKLFAKFDKCKAVYCDLWSRGLRGIEQLTVAP